MSISTATETDLLKRGRAEWARRVDIAERLAASIYPWTALEFEIRAQKVVCGFPPLTSKVDTASLWMRLQLLGDAVAEKSGTFFPVADWGLDEAETGALFSVTPFTIDETLLGCIVAFAEASRRLFAPDISPEDRTRFRAVLIGLAKESRIDWIKSLKRARRKKSDLRAIDVAPGWFRIEYPPNIAEIHKALKEDDELSARKARRDGLLA